MTMNLILWRHADTHPGSPDLARELTKKGEKQAAVMAAWLKSYLPHHTRILCSPARRTRQTADALGMTYEVHDDLAPDVDEALLLQACGWPEAGGTVLVVGHQPTLGRAGALLMTQSPADWTLRKGALWWFTHRMRDDDEQIVLKAAMSPDLLGVR
jgi:phosphohistidine phosphatase